MMREMMSIRRVDVSRDHMRAVIGVVGEQILAAQFHAFCGRVVFLPLWRWFDVNVTVVCDRIRCRIHVVFVQDLASPAAHLNRGPEPLGANYCRFWLRRHKRGQWWRLEVHVDWGVVALLLLTWWWCSRWCCWWVTRWRSKLLVFYFINFILVQIKFPFFKLYLNVQQIFLWILSEPENPKIGYEFSFFSIWAYSGHIFLR